ncbi:hypothetical protein ACFQGT_19150 [Natrialbaceae archaeon GCM10025810]|uniref:hypothetical protein n=1 Tax=Halovalidus salilacus TaxID=3075124 RepID=UPI0036103943
MIELIYSVRTRRSESISPTGDRRCNRRSEATEGDLEPNDTADSPAALRATTGEETTVTVTVRGGCDLEVADELVRRPSIADGLQSPRPDADRPPERPRAGRSRPTRNRTDPCARSGSPPGIGAPRVVLGVRITLARAVAAALLVATTLDWASADPAASGVRIALGGG